MSNDSDRFDGFSAFVGIIIGGLISCVFWILIIFEVNGSWKKEAIENGNAKYNEKTSSFEWIDHSVLSEPLSEKDE